MNAIEHRPIFHACIANAVQESKLLISNLVEFARNALILEEAESRDYTQRSLINNALRKLQTHEHDLVKAYPQALRYVVSQAALPSSSPRNTAVALDKLSLVEEDDIMAEVEMSRTQQLATQLAEIPLTELDTLVSAAQGLESVQPKSNPLRPENYIRALQQVVVGTGVSGQVRQFWMRHMREHLGHMLADTYQRTADHLRQQGVVPVGYAVVAPAGGLRNNDSPPPAVQQPDHAAAVQSHWDDGMATSSIGQTRIDPVMDHITGHVPTVAAVGVMEDITHIDQLVARLPTTQIAPLEGHIQIATFAATRPAAVAAPAALAPQAVLRQMMENIAKDTHLLPAVRQAILRLEPALAQLVGHDAQFFLDAQHPARQLLDELTQRSLAFTGEATPELKRFMRLVTEVVDYLAVVEIHSAAPFAQILKALAKVWDMQQIASSPATMQEPSSPKPNERHEQLVREFAAEFAAYPAIKDSPEDWRAFITGPWAEVAALAHSSQPNPTPDSDPCGYRALVPLLLRCACSEELRTKPHDMEAVLAEAIPLVQQGLESIHASQEYTAYVLKRLSQWQQQAHEYAAILAQDKKRTGHTLWEQPQKAGGISSASHTSAHLPSEQSLHSVTSISSDSSMLRIGQWVDIANNQRLVRAQLTWCSSNNMVFMFTGEDGNTLSMTRRMIDRLTAEGAFLLLP